MTDDLRRLRRWLARSRPPRRALARALLASTIATTTAVGLFVGAVGLLVESASRPGLRAVAGLLIVIELFAFLRSPIKFNERMSAHQLGFAAVTRWRRWLVSIVGHWPMRRWRVYASGDLLERALRDTDELQDLWLRFVVPSFGAIVTLVVGDAVIAGLSPGGRWLGAAGAIAVIQTLGVLGLVADLAPRVAADRDLRRQRGAFRATLVELGTAGPEMILIGARGYLDDRLRGPRLQLARAENRAQRRAIWSSLVVPVTTALALSALYLSAPVSAPVWTVVATLLALSTAEGLGVVRVGLESAIAVIAAAERLEELEEPTATRSAPWPQDSSVVADRVTIREGDRLLVDQGSFVARPGQRVAITGPSGTGKSTLLSALAGLDDVDGGVICIGATPLRDIAEPTLRAHLAYVPSDVGLLRGYAHDVVNLGRTVSRSVERDLAALGLDIEPTTRWTDVSRGEAQRIAIVRALAIGPSIVMLDEATSGLGREETVAVLRLLDDAHVTVIAATHDPHVIAWCDQVVALQDGALVTLSR